MGRGGGKGKGGTLNGVVSVGTEACALTMLCTCLLRRPSHVTSCVGVLDAESCDLDAVVDVVDDGFMGLDGWTCWVWPSVQN